METSKSYRGSSLKNTYLKLITTFIVLVPTLLGIFPLSGGPVYAFFVGLIILGLLVYWKDKEIKAGRLLTFISILLFFGILLYKLSLERLPLNLYMASEVLIFILLITEKSFRNYLYLFLLSFLNLTVVSLYFADLSYGIVLFLYLFVSLFFFLLLSFSRHSLPDGKVVKTLLKLASLIYIGIFLLGTVLFFILPRPAKPIFQIVKTQKTTAEIGFTDEINLGEISRIQQNDVVVFRAKLNRYTEGKPYWRGNVLEKFNGKSWVSVKESYTRRVEYTGVPVVEEILLNPYGGKFIFAYGFAQRALKPFNLIRDKNKLIFLSRKPIFQPTKVKVIANTAVRVELMNKKLLLELPPQTQKLAKKILKKLHLKEGTSLKVALKRLDNYFSHFEYSLTTPAKNLEEFLIKYKKGNCEYFASAAAVLLRALGYPSRVVIGFLGGVKNPLTDYWVVSQKNAHAWVEIYHNHTWITYDPTSFAQATPQVQRLIEQSKGFNLKMLLDTLNTLWLVYIVDLNQEKQITVLTHFVSTIKQFTIFVKENITYLGVFVSIFVLFWVYRIRKKLKVCLFNSRLKVKHHLEIPLCATPDYVYNLLWKKYPDLLQRYEEKLKKLIREYYLR
ncbi:MAG: DUF3488 domain-containing transglutaminase family protein [Aquificae bacterium]|nr:DUF3488 domain-containing transglutaminase family protein [Aquificota bacterium]